MICITVRLLGPKVAIQACLLVVVASIGGCKLRVDAILYQSALLGAVSFVWTRFTSTASAHYANSAVFNVPRSCEVACS